MSSEQHASCHHCGYPVSTQHSGPCPRCGQPGIVEIRVARDAIHVHATEGGELETLREFYKKNPILIFISLALTIASSFAGVVIVGPVGLVLGLLLGFVAFLIGPRAVTHFSEIRRTRIG